MISMDQYYIVRTDHRVYEKSIRTIERETGHDRKTSVKSYGVNVTGYRFYPGANKVSCSCESQPGFV